MNGLYHASDKIFKTEQNKIIISKPASKECKYKKIVITRKSAGYQAEKFTEKQVFHDNIPNDELTAYCLKLLNSSYLQLNSMDEKSEHILLISRKGKVSYKQKPLSSAVNITSAHNREKHYILPEGEIIPPLIDMGIFTSDGKVINSMYDKFRQINRFIEIIDDALRSTNPKHLNIIDFGCGKSYLTFILYYYLTEIRNISVNITGLDLKSDVIKHCNETAAKYGYKNLHFKVGDVSGYSKSGDTDMVITLHACDTATDYALYHAITGNAKMIFSVPCCQHEINSQIKTDRLALLTRYGIIKERTSALITDAIRGNLLEACGYKTQLLEFIDFAHTPKNILIRAVKRPVSAAAKEKALREVKNIMEEFNITPTLYRLLYEEESNENFRKY